MTARALYPLITRDAILDGMIAALAGVTALTGETVTAQRYLRTVGRYMGELTNPEAFKRGVAGRCPAVRVAFISDRTIRGTIGRRVDLVEGTFSAVVFSDTSKSKDDREILRRLSEKVSNLLSSRRYGLEIKPTVSLGVAERPTAIENCTAYSVGIKTRYRIDHSIEADYVTMGEAYGDIVAPEEEERETPYLGVETGPLNEEADA